LVESTEQLAVLNEKLAVQRVAVAEKTAACTLLLTEITGATAIGLHSPILLLLLLLLLLDVQRVTVQRKQLHVTYTTVD